MSNPSSNPNKEDGGGGKKARTSFHWTTQSKEERTELAQAMLQSRKSKGVQGGEKEWLQSLGMSESVAERTLTHEPASSSKSTTHNYSLGGSHYHFHNPSSSFSEVQGSYSPAFPGMPFPQWTHPPQRQLLQSSAPAQVMLPGVTSSQKASNEAFVAILKDESQEKAMAGKTQRSTTATKQTSSAAPSALPETGTSFSQQKSRYPLSQGAANSKESLHDTSSAASRSTEKISSVETNTQDEEINQQNKRKPSSEATSSSLKASSKKRIKTKEGNNKYNAPTDNEGYNSKTDEDGLRNKLKRMKKERNAAVRAANDLNAKNKALKAELKSNKKLLKARENAMQAILRLLPNDDAVSTDDRFRLQAICDLLPDTETPDEK